MILERIKNYQLGNLCDEYAKPEMWLDPLTDGMWDVNPSDGHPSFGAARVRRIQVMYQLDDHQVSQLKSICFSKSARERSAAKLNLYSRTQAHILADIKAKPKRVPRGSRANSSRGDIGRLRCRDSNQTKCVACNTPITLTGVTYFITNVRYGFANISSSSTTKG